MSFQHWQQSWGQTTLPNVSKLDVRLSKENDGCNYTLGLTRLGCSCRVCLAAPLSNGCTVVSICLALLVPDRWIFIATTQLNLSMTFVLSLLLLPTSLCYIQCSRCSMLTALVSIVRCERYFADRCRHTNAGLSN